MSCYIFWLKTKLLIENKVINASVSLLSSEEVPTEC